MSSVKTAGQLRQFILESMEEVKAGKLTPERASIAIKGAAQINESIYSEIKAKQLAKSMGEVVHQFGKLPLVEDNEAQ